eukprot:COSAG01_NODE_954_length_12493_cov_8.138454_8_plen_34_part_00
MIITIIIIIIIFTLPGERMQLTRVGPPQLQGRC